jgi:hypothetical protein
MIVRVVNGLANSWSRRVKALTISEAVIFSERAGDSCPGSMVRAIFKAIIARTPPSAGSNILFLKYW